MTGTYGNNIMAQRGWGGLPAPYGRRPQMLPNGGAQMMQDGSMGTQAPGSGMPSMDMLSKLFSAMPGGGFGGFSPFFGGFSPWGGFGGFGGFGRRQQGGLPAPGGSQSMGSVTPAASPALPPPASPPPVTPPHGDPYPTQPQAGGSGSGPPDATRTYWDGMTWRAPT